MILVCKNNKVIAYHDDNQDDIINKYPADHEIIKVDIVEFDEDGWPLYPRSGGTNLRTMGNTEQRIADLEAAIAAILGGGI
jgi:hypothetical protein